MDSSVAGKPPGILPIEGWGHEPPTTGKTPVEPGQSVNPPRDSQYLRDKHRDDSGEKFADSTELQDRAGSSAQAREDSDKTVTGTPPQRNYLQAVDPKTGQVSIQAVDPATGYVLWQAPLPEGPFENLDTGTQKSLDTPAAAEGESPQTTGLLGKRAYEHHDDAQAGGPRVEITA